MVCEGCKFIDDFDAKTSKEIIQKSTLTVFWTKVLVVISVSFIKNPISS